ncbi:MAG TPA: hypothetical protein VHK91_05950 [Flavisolibacter sp.]|nr:hypothetical protein [Flavisolibacter sp.]
MKKVSVLLICFAFMVSACKKEKAANTSEINVENISGTYVFTRITLKAGTGPETDVTDLSAEPCQKDDLFILAKNGTYSIFRYRGYLYAQLR